MEKSWTLAGGNNFYLTDEGMRHPLLQKGIYDLRMDPKGNLYLAKLENKFEFDFKVYGLEHEFIERVIKTYKSTKGSMV